MPPLPTQFPATPTTRLSPLGMGSETSLQSWFQNTLVSPVRLRPPAAQAADDITYTIEGSLDLAGFPATVIVVSPITAGLPPSGTGYEYRSFSLSGSNGLSGIGFLRAKVTSQ